MGCSCSRQCHEVLHLAAPPGEEKTLGKANVSEEVTLTFTRMIPSDSLAMRIGAETNLRVLKLEFVALGDAGVKAICGAAPQSLRAVRFANCGLGSAGAKAAAGLRVDILDLQGNAIRADGVKGLMKALGKKERFDLKLSDNPLVGTPANAGVRALADLAEALVDVPTALHLANVGLRFETTSKDGMRFLAALAIGRFMDVDLSWNGLQSHAVHALANALKKRRRRTREDDDDEVTPEIRAVYDAAFGVHDGHGLSARYVAFDIDRSQPKTQKIETVAETLGLTSDAVLAVAKRYRLIDADHVDLAKWRKFMVRTGTRIHGTPFARLDIRHNPLGQGQRDLVRAWRTLRVGCPLDQLLLLDSPDDVPASQIRRPSRTRTALSSSSADEEEETTKVVALSYAEEEATNEDTPATSSSSAEEEEEPTTKEDLPATEASAPSLLKAAAARAAAKVTKKPQRRSWHLQASSKDDISDRIMAAIAQSTLDINFVIVDKRPPDYLTAVDNLELPWDWVHDELNTALRPLGALHPVPNETTLDDLQPSAFEDKEDDAKEDELDDEEKQRDDTKEDDSTEGKEETLEVVEDVDEEDVIHVEELQPQKWTGAALKMCRLLQVYEDGGNDLHAAFAKFDVSQDNELSVRELWRGLTALGKPFDGLLESDVRDVVVAHCDTDNDGHVNFDEFKAFVKKGRTKLGIPPSDATPLSEASMKVVRLLLTFESLGNNLDDAFTQFDTSGDGEIAVAELHRSLSTLGAGFDALSRDDVETIVREACVSCGGDHITRDEFRLFVERGRAQLHHHHRG